MRKFRIALISMAAGAAAVANADLRGATDVVKLAPVEVTARRTDFGFEIDYDEVSAKVQGALVTWVGPGMHKQGLRVGDRIDSIDGKPIRDLTLGELLSATKRKLGPGESQVLVFSGTRMLIRRVSFSYTTKGPNQSPQRNAGIGPATLDGAIPPRPASSSEKTARPQSPRG